MFKKAAQLISFKSRSIFTSAKLRGSAPTGARPKEYGGFIPPKVDPVDKYLAEGLCTVMWLWIFYRAKQDLPHQLDTHGKDTTNLNQCNFSGISFFSHSPYKTHCKHNLQNLLQVSLKLVVSLFLFVSTCQSCVN
eukprot:maker-scaffold_1-snap-gene-11.32-mRNA-1 protein AED:0.04 eAED:0.18 QI:0/0/0.33/1/0/0/3/422/134